MGSQPVVREARTDDVPALARLTGELGYPTTVEQMAKRLAPIAADRDRATFVAESAGAIVGYAGVWCGQNYEADRPQARVMALVVSEGSRRCGVGKLLMEAVERWSRERGVGVVVLNTGDRRSEAHAFYERLGYTTTARRYLKRLAPP